MMPEVLGACLELNNFWLSNWDSKDFKNIKRALQSNTGTIHQGPPQRSVYISVY